MLVEALWYRVGTNVLELDGGASGLFSVPDVQAHVLSEGGNDLVKSRSSVSRHRDDFFVWF